MKSHHVIHDDSLCEFVPVTVPARDEMKVEVQQYKRWMLFSTKDFNCERPEHNLRAIMAG